MQETILFMEFFYLSVHPTTTFTSQKQKGH